MSYILRLKGKKKGYSFYSCLEEGYNFDINSTYQFMSCEKLKYAEEFITLKEAQDFKTQWDKANCYDIVTLNAASRDYYGEVGGVN